MLSSNEEIKVLPKKVSIRKEKETERKSIKLNLFDHFIDQIWDRNKTEGRGGEEKPGVSYFFIKLGLGECERKIEVGETWRNVRKCERGRGKHEEKGSKDKSGNWDRKIWNLKNLEDK